MGTPAGERRLNYLGDDWNWGDSLAGERAPHPTRHCRSPIAHFERDDKARMVVSALISSQRRSPHWWGGPMRSAPGGRRLRQSLIRPLEPEIAREAKRWWTEPQRRSGQYHNLINCVTSALR